MKKICQYCKKELEFKKHQQFGAHTVHCNSNPNKKDRIKKFQKTRHDNLFKKYKFNCLNCGKEYEIETTEKTIKRNKHQKCCCKKCAYIYSNSFIDYNKTKKAKCVECGDEIIIKNNSSLKNCLCEKCGGGCDHNKTSKIIRNIKKLEYKFKKIKIINNKAILYCTYCGQEKCSKPEICKRFNILHSFYKFGFNKDFLGTIQYYDEFERIIQLLKDEYWINKLTLTEIGKKYKFNFQTISSLFKRLNIKSRTLSEAQSLSYELGKSNLQNIPIYPYKSGWHETWNGKKVFYRSSYEQIYCKELDENKIDYDVEFLRIKYWDSQKNKFRTAIPDFYLSETNEIVEIKSKWTYDKQNMVDRSLEYKKLGYKFKLFIDKKEVVI